MVTRKGALKPINVPLDILDKLNSGAIETVNLAECLAVDFAILMAQVVPELASVAKNRIPPTDEITKRMAATGKLLLEHFGAAGVEELAAHPSEYCPWLGCLSHGGDSRPFFGATIKLDATAC